MKVVKGTKRAKKQIEISEAQKNEIIELIKEFYKKNGYYVASIMSDVKNVGLWVYVFVKPINNKMKGVYGLPFINNIRFDCVGGLFSLTFNLPLHSENHGIVETFINIMKDVNKKI